MDQLTDNGLGIDQGLWAGLRECQKTSIQQALLYTRIPLADQGGKSCLISLPTGAGKSGVISVIAHHVEQKKILVLCHRRAVSAQLMSEISGAFFTKASPTSSIQLSEVFDGISDIDTNGVYITTFQMLNRLKADRLAEVQNFFDLIIIDEGHAEPSPVWRTLVRGTNAHKIVVTATPYRNDLFQFDVSPTLSYIYTFSEALEEEILSEPLFDSIEESSIVQRVSDFLNDFPEAKCIVKCKTFDRVEYFLNIFESHFQTIAIHERYKKDERNNVKTAVPKNIATSEYRILVHQHKLDEGVDIPAAKLLVLTYALGSGRELVQTIGRVVRVFKEIEPVVIEFDHQTNLIMWSSYRDFDNSLRSSEGVIKFLASLNTGRLIELYLDAFPAFSYHGNSFVGKFDINTFDPDLALSIPTASICFLKTDEGFALSQTADTLYWRATNQGELSKVFSSSGTSIVVILSIAFNKSRFLTSELFFEPSLELILLKQMDNGVVAVFDSRGRTFSSDSELKFGTPLEQEKLLKVMARGASMRPKEASTRAIGATRKRPEAMHIKGPNLDELGGQQQFAAYRMSTIKCDTLDNQGRKSGTYYVGVDAGRISDHMDRHFSLKDLDEWFLMIETCLASGIEANSRMLNAFSKPIAPSSALVIESVVFDFSSEESPIVFCVDGAEFEISNEFSYYSYTTGIELNEGLVKSKLLFEIGAEQPYVDISLSEDLELLSPEGYDDVKDFLLKSVHKILFKDGITYSGGRLYELRLPTQDGFSIHNSELGGVLVGMPELLRADLTEKGNVGREIQTINDEFSADSVFHLVDKLKNISSSNSTIADLGPFYPYMPKPDYIICSDMGTEPADFIIMSPEKIAYVHIKCGSSEQRPQSSAGALAEVGSQAIKNLEMLISGDRNLRAANWTNLLTEWPEAGAPQHLANRIRLFEGHRFDGSTSPTEPALDQLWAVLTERRRSIGVHKEIWIVAANSFSSLDFEAQMRLGAEGRSESLQAYQLLQAWMSAASYLDAEIRVFVSP